MRRRGAPLLWARLVGDLLHHLPRTAVAALFVIPLLWVVSASIRTPRQPPPRTIEWIPDPIAWSNYIEIFDLVPIETYLGNSLLVALIGVPLTVVTASWAGLAMAQMPSTTRRNLLVFAVMLLMVPITALWLTRFLIFRYLGLIDTIWALVAPAAMGMSPLFILLFYWTFRRMPSNCSTRRASTARACFNSGRRSPCLWPGRRPSPSPF
jgi:multiple sugar transport system permease protein